MQKIGVSHSGRTSSLSPWRAGSLVLLTLAACVSAAETTSGGRDPVAEVTAFERQLEKLYSSEEFIKDPTIAISYYEKSPELRMFDALGQLQFKGADVGQHIVDVGNQFFGTVKFYDLEIAADGKLGFASMLQHFVGKLKDGSPVDFIMRVTDCLRWSNGHWLILHEHISVPVEPAAFAAMIKVKK